jgi:hypothetical protein
MAVNQTEARSKPAHEPATELLSRKPAVCTGYGKDDRGKNYGE